MLHKPYKSYQWNDYTKLAWVLAYMVVTDDKLLVTYHHKPSEEMAIINCKPMYEKRVDDKKVHATIDGVPLWLVQV
jgi:hypothetical protein